jgi:AcrR family transcriptional regulator
MSRAMADVKPRGRRERARATRTQISRAAYELFCERGYAATTMTDVAIRAGVAVQTVYFIFHTKPDLLGGAYELAVMGDDDPRPPQAQGWYADAVAATTVQEAIALVVAGAGAIERRVAPLSIVVRAAAQGDEESRAVWRRHEDLRIEGFRGLTAMLTQKAPLRPGLDEARATDLLLMLLGGWVYLALVIDGGWSHEEWVDWATWAVGAEVFGLVDPGGTRTAPRRSARR